MLSPAHAPTLLTSLLFALWGGVLDRWWCSSLLFRCERGVMFWMIGMGIYSASLRLSERLLGLDDCESRVAPRTPVREGITARTGRAFSAKRTYKMPLTGNSCKGRREDSIFIFLYDSHSCGQNHRGDASGNVWNRGNLRMHLSFFLFWCRTMLHQ